MKIKVIQKENNLKNEFQIFYNNELKYIAKVPSVSIDKPLKIDDIRKIKVSDTNRNVIYTTNYNYINKKNNKYSSFSFLITGEQAFNQLLFVAKNKSIKIYYEENKEFNRYVIDISNRKYYCYSVNDGYIRHFPIFYKDKQVAEILKSNIADNDEYICYIQKEFKVIRDAVALLVLYLDRSEYNFAYVSDRTDIEFIEKSSNKYYDKNWVKYNFDATFFDEVDAAVALLKDKQKKLKKVKKKKIKKEKITKEKKKTEVKKEEISEEIVNEVDLPTLDKNEVTNLEQSNEEVLTAPQIKTKKRMFLFPKFKGIKFRPTKSDIVEDIKTSLDEAEEIRIAGGVTDTKKKPKIKLVFPKFKRIIKSKKLDYIEDIKTDLDETGEIKKISEIIKEDVNNASPIEEIAEPEVLNIEVPNEIESTIENELVVEEESSLETETSLETEAILEDKSSLKDETGVETEYVEEEDNNPVIYKSKRKFSFYKLWILSIFIIIIILLISYFVNEYQMRLQKQREEAAKDEKIITGDVQVKIISIDSAKISKDEGNKKLHVEGKMKLSYSEEKFYSISIWGYCLGDEGEKYIVYAPDSEENDFHDGSSKYNLVNTVNNETGDVIYRDGTTKKFDDIVWDNVRIKSCKIEKLISYSKLKDNITVKSTKKLKFEKEIK